MNKDLFNNPSISKLARINTQFDSLIKPSQLDAITKLQNSFLKANKSIFTNTALLNEREKYLSFSSKLKPSYFEQMTKIENSISKFARINTQFDSLIKPSQLDAITKLQNSFLKANKSTFTNTALLNEREKYLSFSSKLQPSYFERMTKIESSISKFSRINTQFDAITKLQSSFLKANKSIFTDTVSIFEDDDLLRKILLSIDKQPTAVINVDYTPSINELNSATELLYDTDKNSFLNNFYKLPIFLQMIIMYMIMSFIIPITNNIAANLLTPIVQSYIDDLLRSDTDKIRDIKKSPTEVLNTKVYTNNLRFITGNNVNVRSNPSIKSEILDQLMLGKIVEIISKEKNWIEISYKQGEYVIHGWVFTRYTKRFKY